MIVGPQKIREEIIKSPDLAELEELTEIEKIHGPLPKLEIADIVFIRFKKNFKRKLLRAVTNSYWDHTALVLFDKDPHKGYPENLIAESHWGGVKVHKIRKYLNDARKYDVGIKRVPWLTNELRDRIRAFMLLNVDAPYYPFSFWKLVISLISEPVSRYLLGRQRYSCSGFVQKSYYEAVDWSDRFKVVFTDEYVSPLQFQDIISPGEIAASKKSKWIYNEH
jgi:hypothetical protein